MGPPSRTASIAPAPPQATLRQLREAGGVSLRDIAQQVGFTNNTVSRIEKGLQWPDDADLWEPGEPD